MYVFTDSLGALKEAVLRPSGGFRSHELVARMEEIISVLYYPPTYEESDDGLDPEEIAESR